MHSTRIISIRHRRCYFLCWKFRGTLRRSSSLVLFGTNRGRLNFHCKFHSIWFFSYVTIRLDEPPFDSSSIYATVDEAALSKIISSLNWLSIVFSWRITGLYNFIHRNRRKVVFNIYLFDRVSFSWLSYLNIFLKLFCDFNNIWMYLES